MKKFLLLFLFSLPLVLAQTSKQSKQSESLPMTKKMIDEKLDYINDNYDSIDLKQQEIHMRLGIFYLEYADTKGNLELAEKNLLKAQEFYDNKDYNISPELGKTILLNQLSWLYMEKKDYKKSIDFANRSLELEKTYKCPTARVKSFEFLATCYTELGEKEKSKLYLQKYTVLKDSINIANRAVMKGMVKDVDNNHQESLKKPLILIWILIVIIVILFLLRRKNKTIYKKYEETIVKIKTENEQKDFLIEDQVDILKAKSSFNITDETTKKLLQKLKKFETSDRYLRKEISLTWLANNLHTNPRYLSEIIKIYKNKNFTSYINGLRISYIIKKLYGIPIYRDYKISYLAEECGYLTPRVFLTAFKNETGFTPSHFVQLLKDK